MKKNVLLLLITFLFALFLTGCAVNEAELNKIEPSEDSLSVNPSVNRSISENATLPNGLVDGKMVDYTTTASFSAGKVIITFQSTIPINQVYLYTPGFTNMTKDGSSFTASLDGFNKGDIISWYFCAIGNGQADNHNQMHTWTVEDGGSTFPPEVTLTSPAEGSKFDEGANITITANASDSDGTVTKVEFFRGSTLIGTDSDSPYSSTWNNAQKGSYELTAVAYDDTNEKTTSSVVTITVGSSSPGKGFSYSGKLPNGLVEGKQLEYSCTAVLNGSDVEITFETGTALNQIFLFTPDFNNMVKDGSVWKASVPGYSVNDTITWYFCAIGAGQADNSTERHSWTISDDPIDFPPAVSITSPANGAKFFEGTDILITADASDQDGQITKVSFYRGNILISEDTTFPYSAVWTNAEISSVDLRAVATDDQGLTSSDSVAVEVTPEGTKLILSVDRVSIVPNGADAVTMSVNLPGQTEYYANGARLSGNSFTTTIEGLYVLHAVVNGEKSNEVTINARNPGNTLPYIIENRSRYSDDEIYIAVIGKRNPDHPAFVWMNLNDFNTYPVNDSYNTLKRPGSGANEWLYADISIKLSDLQNNTINIPKLIYGTRIFIGFKEQVYFHFHPDGGFTQPDLNNPSDPNKGTRFELIELTWADNGLWTNTTRVDSYQYPMGLEVWGENNFYKKIGEIKTHQEIIASWQNRVPTEFLACYVTDNYDIDGIIKQASKTPEFSEDGPYNDYFDNYIDAIWEKFKNDELVTWFGDRGIWRGKVIGEEMVLTGPDGTVAKIAGRPTTQDAIEGKGRLAEDVPSTPDPDMDKMIQAQFVAAINRGAIDLSIPSGGNQDWSIESDYFQPGNEFNEYVKFWHSHDISYNSETYAFSYDDVFDHSSTIQTNSPTSVKVTIGGFAQ